MSMVDQYKAATTADVEAPSGFRFRVRGLTMVQFGDLIGSIPNVFDVQGESAASSSGQKMNDEYNRKTIESCVLGIVDDSGGVSTIGYDDLTAGDVTFLVEAVLIRSGVSGRKAEELRRALRG